MTCQHPNKVAHPTREAARRHIASLYKAGKGNPDLTVYGCDDGKHFHVGHNAVKFSKRIRRALRRKP